MTPQPDPREVGELFDVLFDLTPAQREEYRIEHHPDPRVWQRVEQLLAATPPDHLQTPSDSDSSRVSARPDEEEPPRLPGLEPLGRIDEGGMGVVWRVRDPQFERTLAVKVMKSRLCRNPNAVRRFEAEARVTGQLAHPAIVPVHAMGRLPDGRPYYTMKLVEGETLTDLLRGRSDLASRRMELVQIFAQVCQALGFAHSRGVIHRDLKPANVMVGRHGEVQVMDWGLAKVQTDTDALPAESAEVNSTPGEPRPETGEHTRPGAELGTWAYMPPEQARGVVAEVDWRSDVFGLGAILCEILTGKPPYVDSGAGPVWLQAKEADLEGALTRLRGCGADPELIRLAEWCLAPRKSDRPADAGEVAAAVTAHQAAVQERLQQERLERERQQVKAAEERRRRKLWAIVVTAVLVVIGGATAGGLYWQGQRVQQRQDATQALGKAEDRLQAGDAAGAEAEVGRAEGRLGDSGPPDLGQWLGRLKEDLLLVTQLIQVRQRRFVILEGKFNNKLSLEGYEQGFTRTGLDIQFGDSEELATTIRDSAIRLWLVAALDDWAFLADLEEDDELRDRLLELARRAETDSGPRNRLRDPKVWERPEELRRLTAELDLTETSPELVCFLGQLLPEADREALLRAAHPISPGDFWLNFQLGTLLSIKGSPEAVGYLRVALASQPKSVAVLNNLGNALKQTGKLDEAIVHLRHAVQLAPDYPHSHNGLGGVLLDKDAVAAVGMLGLAAHNGLGVVLPDNGQLDLAIKHFREATRLEHHPYFHHNLGLALARKGDSDGAIASWLQAVGIDPDFEPSHAQLGDTFLLKKNDAGAAIRHYREVVRISPQNGKAHAALGSALSQAGQLPEATRCFETAIRLKPDLDEAHHNLGVICDRERRPEEAIRHFRRAIDLNPEHVSAHFGLANALQDTGEMGLAIEHYQKAIRLDPKFVDARVNLGAALEKLGKTAEAVEPYREAVRIDPRDALAHRNLGFALSKLGKTEEAIDPFRKAVDLDPLDAEAHSGLASVLKQVGKLEEALKHFRETTRLKPELAIAHGMLGEALLEHGLFPDARSSFQRFLELLPERDPLRADVQEQLTRCEQLGKLDARWPRILAGEAQPADVAERLALAWLCLFYKKRPVEAVRYYVEAFEKESKTAEDLYARHRYQAAKAAVLAAADGGNDKLDDKERARSRRRQALAWLRADLTAWTKVVESGPPQERELARDILAHLQKDTNLATVRNKDALKKLPETEQLDWHQFWADVGALMRQITPEEP